MTIQELIDSLKKIVEKQNYCNNSTCLGCDYERDHVKADELLLAYIDNEEVTEAFNNIYKWYA